MTPGTPQTEAGRTLWESMAGGADAVDGPFGASARHLGSSLAAIEAEAVAAERRRLRPEVEALRQSHLVVDGDCWFSCPLAKSEWHDGSASCNDEDIAAGRCTCGAEAQNERVDAVLALLADPS